MLELCYPETVIAERQQDGIAQLFDPLRKKWISRTPEEWVRQQFIQLLLISKGYPASLMAVEKSLRLGSLNKRFDILIYDKDHRPWMMIECKAPEVALTFAVLEQLLRYNISIPVRYLLITNGPYCMGWARTEKGLTALEKIPDWEG